MYLTKYKFSLKALAIAMVLLPFYATAQNCNFNIDYSCWFSAQTTIYSVSWNPTAGDKLAVNNTEGGSPYTAFCGNSNSDVVLNMGSGAVSRNATLSKNYDLFNGNILYTKVGGIFMGNNYITPSGTAVSAVTGGLGNRYGSKNSVDRDTVVYVTISGSTYKLNYADLSNPSSPVFHTITTISGIPNTQTGLPSDEALASAGNRIYLATKNFSCDNCYNTAGNPDSFVIIKCRDFGGNVCPNWTDVNISNGEINDIEIRPTDGMIFARGRSRGYGSNGEQVPVPGMIIFDSTGTLATGFNFTDLSLITSRYDGLVRFDANGNIFANTTNGGMGIYKFDPKGNVDLDFMRNLTNSYSLPSEPSVQYFDVNPITGMVAIVLNNSTESKYHALAGGEHKQANNEFWSNAFQSIGTGDGASTVGQKSADGYNILHLLYNNGKLKVQGETTTTQSSNCGTKTPTVTPYKDPAAGTIQCNGLSFITAPMQGTVSTLVVKVPINVTSVGVFNPITVSGSGMTMQDPYETFNATTVGITDFYLTLKYDGSTLGTFNISVGGAGSCSANLADQTKNNPSVVPIWTPQNCTYKVIGPDLK